MVNFIKKIIILMCIFFIQLGCDVGGLDELPPNFDPKNLIGDYLANHKFGKDQLSINSNGTFNFKYKSLNDKIFEGKGTWKFQGKQIILNDYIPFWQRDAHFGGPITTKPISWKTYVQVKNEKIMIIMNWDEGYYYIKV